MNYMPIKLQKERRYTTNRRQHRSTPKPHNLPPLENPRARVMHGGMPEPQQFARITPRQGMDNNGHQFFRGTGGMAVNPRLDARRGRGSSMVQHEVAPVMDPASSNMWHNNLESWMNAKGGEAVLGGEVNNTHDPILNQRLLFQC